MSEIEVLIEPLGPQHDRGAFQCGERFIDNFFKKKCLDAHERYKARAYVARQPSDQRALGFYTLSLTSLSPQGTTPEDAQQKFGGWAVPFVYLGQIGVSKDTQGMHVGSALMLHAFERTLEIANIAGTFGLMLDAIDEERAKWYERLSFDRFDVEADGRIKMYCPIRTIAAALSAPAE